MFSNMFCLKLYFLCLIACNDVCGGTNVSKFLFLCFYSHTEIIKKNSFSNLTFNSCNIATLSKGVLCPSLLSNKGPHYPLTNELNVTQ